MSSSLHVSFEVGQRVRLNPAESLSPWTQERLGPEPYRIVDVRETPESPKVGFAPRNFTKGSVYDFLRKESAPAHSPHPQQVKVTNATGDPAWDGDWITGLYFVPVDS